MTNRGTSDFPLFDLDFGFLFNLGPKFPYFQLSSKMVNKGIKFPYLTQFRWKSAVPYFESFLCYIFVYC